MREQRTEFSVRSATISVLLAVSTLCCAGRSAYRRASDISAEDTPAVMALLYDSDWRVAATAAQALGERPESQATDALLRVVESQSDWRIRAYASHALANHLEPQVLPVIERVARTDPEVGVREESVSTLATLRSLEVAVTLVRLSADSLPSIRERALTALSTLVPTASSTAGMSAAASQASNGSGNIDFAIRYWREFVARAGKSAPSIDGEIQRLERIQSERRTQEELADARARAERLQAETKMEEQAQADKRQREQAAAEWEAGKPMREQQAKDNLAAAFKQLRKGKLAEAISHADSAAALGAETLDFRKAAAEWDWKKLGGHLSGPALADFINKWSEASPLSALRRSEQETTEKASCDVDSIRDAAGKRTLQAAEVTKSGSLMVIHAFPGSVEFETNERDWNHESSIVYLASFAFLACPKIDRLRIKVQVYLLNVYGERTGQTASVAEAWPTRDAFRRMVRTGLLMSGNGAPASTWIVSAGENAERAFRAYGGRRVR